jgi:hypothetical protein
MNVEIGAETPISLFWGYLFRYFVFAMYAGISICATSFLKNTNLIFQSLLRLWEHIKNLSIAPLPSIAWKKRNTTPRGVCELAVVFILAY